MATMISEVYDAFRAAGVSEEQSRKAAEVLANYENRFSKVNLDIADVRSVQRLHSWMLATVIAMQTAILFKLFS